MSGESMNAELKALLTRERELGSPSDGQNGSSERAGILTVGLMLLTTRKVSSRGGHSGTIRRQNRSLMSRFISLPGFIGGRNSLRIGLSLPPLTRSFA